MKRILLSLTLLMTLAVLLQACKKDDFKERTISATVKKNQIYQHNFGLMGIEDGFAISKHPARYVTSALSVDDFGNVIYTYQPAEGYVGRDQVEFIVSLSTGGSIYGTRKTTLKLTVTESGE